MDLKKNRSNVTTLIEHRCSEGCRGFSRVERGTWMGHVIEHIALDTNIGGYGHRIWRTRETKTLGTYNVVFSYTEERWTLRQNQPLHAESNRGN
jgi:hypothetical protein